MKDRVHPKHPAPPAPPPKRVLREDHPFDVRTIFDLFCGAVAITAIAICLVGYGESRGARQCNQLVETTLNQE